MIIKNFSHNGVSFDFASKPEDRDTIPGTQYVISHNLFKFDSIPWKENDVFVDLGCNCGLVSLFIAKSFPFVKVYSFDASTKAIESLNKSIELNGLTNIKTFNVGIDRHDGFIEFHTDYLNSSCLVPNYCCSPNPEDTTIKIQTIAFEKIFEYIKQEKIKYLKMDIEGSEFNIFEDLIPNNNAILNKIEYMHLEIHKNPGKDWSALQSMVKSKFGERVFFEA